MSFEMSGVITKEFNVIANSGELIGTIEHLALYKQIEFYWVWLYLFFVEVMLE
jgi:hypothetical protein